MKSSRQLQKSTYYPVESSERSYPLEKAYVVYTPQIVRFVYPNLASQRIHTLSNYHSLQYNSTLQMPKQNKQIYLTIQKQTKDRKKQKITLYSSAKKEIENQQKIRVTGYKEKIKKKEAEEIQAEYSQMSDKDGSYYLDKKQSEMKKSKRSKTQHCESNEQWQKISAIPDHITMEPIFQSSCGFCDEVPTSESYYKQNQQIEAYDFKKYKVSRRIAHNNSDNPTKLKEKMFKEISSTNQAYVVRKQPKMERQSNVQRSTNEHLEHLESYKAEKPFKEDNKIKIQQSLPMESKISEKAQKKYSIERKSIFQPLQFHKQQTHNLNRSHNQSIKSMRHKIFSSKEEKANLSEHIGTHSRRRIFTKMDYDDVKTEKSHDSKRSYGSIRKRIFQSDKSNLFQPLLNKIVEETILVPQIIAKHWDKIQQKENDQYSMTPTKDRETLEFVDLELEKRFPSVINENSKESEAGSKIVSSQHKETNSEIVYQE